MLYRMHLSEQQVTKAPYQSKLFRRLVSTLEMPLPPISVLSAVPERTRFPLPFTLAVRLLQSTFISTCAEPLHLILTALPLNCPLICPEPSIFSTNLSALTSMSHSSVPRQFQTTLRATIFPLLASDAMLSTTISPETFRSASLLYAALFLRLKLPALNCPPTSILPLLLFLTALSSDCLYLGSSCFC